MGWRKLGKQTRKEAEMREVLLESCGGGVGGVELDDQIEVGRDGTGVGGHGRRFLP